MVEENIWFNLPDSPSKSVAEKNDSQMPDLSLDWTLTLKCSK